MCRIPVVAEISASANGNDDTDGDEKCNINTSSNVGIKSSSVDFFVLEEILSSSTNMSVDAAVNNGCDYITVLAGSDGTETENLEEQGVSAFMDIATSDTEEVFINPDGRSCAERVEITEEDIVPLYLSDITPCNIAEDELMDIPPTFNINHQVVEEKIIPQHYSISCIDLGCVLEAVHRSEDGDTLETSSIYEERDDLKKSLDNALVIIENKDIELVENNQRRKKLEAEHQNLAIKNAMLIREIDEMSKKIMIMEAQNEHLYERLDEGKDGMTTLKEKLHESVNKNHSLSLEIKAKDQTINTLGEELAQVKERGQNLQSNLSYFCDENTRLKNGKKAEPKSEMSSSPEDNAVNKELASIREEMRNFKEEITLEIQKVKKDKEIELTSCSRTVEKGSVPVRPGMWLYSTAVSKGETTTLSSVNKFSSPRFSSNNPQTPECNPDETGKTKGNNNKTLVFSTSITKGIRVNEFNEYLIEGEARFQRFHGGRVKHFKNYLATHLEEERPSTVVLQAGGNDLPTTRKNPTPVSEIANSIIEAGLMCRQYGVSRILISSVLPRAQAYMQGRRRELNDVLRILCEKHRFIFIENNDIILKEHICGDGVHLNDARSTLLARNFLTHLNSHIDT